MFCVMQKAHPSHLFLSYNIWTNCTSPKQEEILLHEIAAEVGGALVKEENENAEDENKNLTYKEKIILGLLLQGFTCKRAGEKLFVSTATVEDHKKHIYEKLDVHSRAELFNRFPHRPGADTIPY